jgi:replicative DNA helicase
MVSHPTQSVQSSCHDSFTNSGNPPGGYVLVSGENGSAVAADQMLLQLAASAQIITAPDVQQEKQKDEDNNPWHSCHAAELPDDFIPAETNPHMPTAEASDPDESSTFERAVQLLMHCLRNPKLFADARDVISAQQFVSIGAWDLADVWSGLEKVVEEFGYDIMQGDGWQQVCEVELRRHIKKPPNIVSYVFGSDGLSETGLLSRAFTPPKDAFPESYGRWLLQKFSVSSLLVTGLKYAVGLEHVASQDPKAYIEQVQKTIEKYEKIGGATSQPMFMSPKEFAKAEFKLDWLIPGVLVEGQPCIVGGPSKAMKTSVMTDLAVSLGTGAGTQFLGHFAVKKPGRRVGFLSCESGGATLQETFMRVCKARQVEFAQCNVYPECVRIPKLGDPKELRNLAHWTKDLGFEVLIIDPVYLCLLAGNPKIDPHNLFQMGQALSDVGGAILEAGATPILVHHTVKHLQRGDREGQFEPITREDLAMTGFAEYMRQWLLLNRRSRFEEGSGKHELWLGVGGSVGFSGTWAVDIHEGVPNEDLKGRTWETRVTARSKHQAEIAREKAIQKESAEQAKERDDEQQLIQTFKHYPDGESRTVLVGEAGLKGKKSLNAIWDRLVRASIICPTQVTKGGGRGNRAYPGWKLTDPNITPVPPAPKYDG